MSARRRSEKKGMILGIPLRGSMQWIVRGATNGRMPSPGSFSASLDGRVRRRLPGFAQAICEILGFLQLPNRVLRDIKLALQKRHLLS